MPYAKNNIRVNVQKRSGFDKRHRNTGTLRCGTLTPILCDEVVPNSRVSLKLNLAAQLPPLASDTYMNLKLKAEAFFVPLRLLCASFESFFCDFPYDVFYYDTDTSRNEFDQIKGCVPYIYPDGWSSATEKAKLTAVGGLADYLGLRVSSVSSIHDLNPLPFAAYHLVWQEWYRNPRVQKPAFAHPLGSSNLGFDAARTAANMPYSFYSRDIDQSGTSDSAYEIKLMTLADGSSLLDLRQRNFGLDYFTGARTSPQQGAAVSMVLPGTFELQADSEGEVSGTISSGFTIAALRAANSLQQFRERNNMPSPRLVDQVKARYGANLSDGVAQRPICIGSASYEVDVNGISQTSPGSEVSGANPFSGVANQYGRAYGAGSDFIISDFVANEPGYILVNISLVPEVTYANGVNPIFKRYVKEGSITDMACSLLQNVGDQPIRQDELLAIPLDNDAVFGYTDRYADFMFCPNSAHGKFRDGQDLDSFVLQRSFTGTPTINDSFLKIPTNYLDQVFAVSDEVSGVSAWYDCMLDYKVSMPLAEYSIPSLQDPAYEHGQPVTLRRNGQIF